METLWKYCTPESCREFVLSLGLLGETAMGGDRQMKCLYALSNHPERHYRTIQIPKKSGGVRTLKEPDALLKRVQKNLLHRVLEPMRVSEHAYAYRKGVSVRENAAVHLGQPEILKLDIEDFFGNITFPMVMARAFPAELFPPPVRMLFTNICCLGDRLPQGAPTSPAVSNLVMEPFDRYMGTWCRERGICYSRYCDDMTFSGDLDAANVEGKAAAFLEAMGFSLNRKKTRRISSGRRQTVTGLTVNEKLQAGREYRRRLRQELYFCEKYGVAGHLERCWGRVPTENETAGYMDSLRGRVNFCLFASGGDRETFEMKAKILKLIKK